MNQSVISIDNVHGYLDEYGTVWLNVEDIARGLGFTQLKNGVEYVRWETVNKYLNEFGYSSLSQFVGKTDFISENMFYRLAMKASNAAAQKFQAKVADEILPSIRKTGSYISPNVDVRQIVNPEFLRRIADELEARDKKIAELQPKADYYDRILQSKEALSISIIAQDYDLSAMAMNRLLAKLKIQHRVGNAWVINSPYKGMGYVVTRTIERGVNFYTHTYWTQKGRCFLYGKLKSVGWLPKVERDEYYPTLFCEELAIC